MLWRVFSSVALAAISMMAVLLPMVLFPVENVWALLAVPICIALICSAAEWSAAARRRAFAWVSIAAGLNLAALMLQGFVQSRWRVPYPDVVGSFLGLDGERAYVADEFEIWLECWIVLAVLLAALTTVVKRLRRSSRTA